jgi:hypothetical protein
MTQPIPSINLPPTKNPYHEGQWLQLTLHQWLDQEYLPEAVNFQIAQRVSQIYIRQRIEGEDDLGSLLIAILIEMRAFDFSKSFYSEFAVANAVSDLLMQSFLDNHTICCGNN